ncbi:hypothetical protein GCM10009527_010170 [Actinomadura nitritigenes]|uniref:Secreted protein n=1 Tax=Actinomadura nitritigenes TaxID=134602 RepID=A0ABS3R1F5_9ACTN|nr:hypothetical protein [Actinomadura nitritigenes]MBO2439895.1 hypothetical protein [Actinomadura nitritigenes]
MLVMLAIIVVLAVLAPVFGADTRDGLNWTPGSAHLRRPRRRALDALLQRASRRSLHRSDSPGGSLRDQVLAGSNLPSGAVATLSTGAGRGDAGDARVRSSGSRGREGAGRAAEAAHRTIPAAG